MDPMNTATIGPDETRAILTPGEAAARLGMDVPDLVAVIRRNRHAYTELKPGGKPGDRGRNRWGLTPRQFEAILRGLERRPPEIRQEAATPLSSPLSPDGLSRLRRGRR
jgi:hypothetical protein